MDEMIKVHKLADVKFIPEKVILKDPISESDDSDVMAFKAANMLAIGDILIVRGTEPKVFGYAGRINKIPKDCELRIHGAGSDAFVIHYPKGYLVWMKMKAKRRRTFKCAIEVTPSEVYYKIWRSK